MNNKQKKWMKYCGLLLASNFLYYIGLWLIIQLSFLLYVLVKGDWSAIDAMEPAKFGFIMTLLLIIGVWGTTKTIQLSIILEAMMDRMIPRRKKKNEKNN